MNNKLNSLRAAVLGSNDGINSLAGPLIGLFVALQNNFWGVGKNVLLTGVLSMAFGEVLSVQSQKDAEKAVILKQKLEDKQDPKREQTELIKLEMKKGVSEETAKEIVKEMSRRKAFDEHVQLINDLKKRSFELGKKEGYRDCVKDLSKFLENKNKEL